MTITVSISDFRQNISEYLSQIQNGDRIILIDKKKKKEVAQLVTQKKFNPETFGRALREAAGVFTAKRHPEWRTKRQVIAWVEKGRREADRNFDYIK